MEKKKIESFIEKYNLNGTLEEVRWLIKDKKLRASAIDSDRKVLVTVTLNNFEEIQDTELCIKTTSDLKKMLLPIADKMQMEIKTVDNRVIAMTIFDEVTTDDYALSDPDSVKAAPGIKTIPDFNVEISLTEAFVKVFDRATSALSDASNLTLIMSAKKKKLEMVLGYSSNINTSRITMVVPTIDGKDTVKEPISFSAKILKQILSVNPEVKDPILKVSEQGLAYIEFIHDDFHSQYYLQKVVMED